MATKKQSVIRIPTSVEGVFVYLVRDSTPTTNRSEATVFDTGSDALMHALSLKLEAFTVEPAEQQA